MSGLTPNLGLFKYDPILDGKEVFSIETALNDNWDILDTKAGSPETVVDGTTWYRRFTDGWKEQGGLVSMAETELPWTQPILSANGSAGGDVPAAYQTGGAGNGAPYQAFDKNTSTFARFYYNGYKLVLYIPYEIKVSKVDLNFTGNGNNEYPTNWSIEGSNDGNSWDTLYTGGNQGTTAVASIPEDKRDWYKYYALHITTGGSSQNTTITEMALTAVYKTLVTNSITFPVAFTNTNYSYTFACQDGGGLDAYVSNKTVTGMTLSNTQSGSASWTACGY